MSSLARGRPVRGRGGLMSLGNREDYTQEMTTGARGMPFIRGRYLPHTSTGRIVSSVNASEFILPEPKPVVSEPIVSEPAVLEQDRVQKYMREMEQRRKMRPPPPPPQYTEPSDYTKYNVTDQARNFPAGHDYTQVTKTTAPIMLSPEAQAYEENEKTLANELESRERGWGGKIKRKYKSVRQKKQRHRRNRRRHSTKKYRK